MSRGVNNGGVTVIAEFTKEEFAIFRMMTDELGRSYHREAILKSSKRTDITAEEMGTVNSVIWEELKAALTTDKEK